MFEKEAEEKYCKGCKSRIEQCLWAWRNTNGLNELKNCSCKEVPNYIRGAEFGYNKAKVEVEESYRESLYNSELNLASVTEQLEELEKEITHLKESLLELHRQWRIRIEKLCRK